MSNLIRQNQADLNAARNRAGMFSPRFPNSVVRRVNAEIHEALIGSARLQGGSYLTHTAITHVALLSGEEARLIQQCPLAESRLKVLVDHFAGLCAYELATFGR